MYRTQTIGMVSWVVLAAAVSAPYAGEAPELATQQERQKQIKGETDRLVRRVETMIRLLEYNRLDKTAEKQLLDQVAGTLGGLSREQMMRLIDALEKAGKVEGEARDKELQTAQERHEQIVLGLKGLLARFDALKSLEQAAERLDKMARDELDQYLQNVQLAWEDENAAKLPKNENSRIRAAKLVGEQLFLQRDLSNLCDQMGELKKLLPPEHQERDRKMQIALSSSNVLDNLLTASRQLRALNVLAERQRQWQKAADSQWQASGDIKELAQILRGAEDKLSSLRQARQLVERAIEEQEGVQQSTRTTPEKEKPDAKPQELTELYLSWARGLSSRQASLEFDTRAIRALLQPHVKELAGRFPTVEKDMRESQTALRAQGLHQKGIDTALAPQESALVKLRAIRAEIDRLLTDAEKAHTNPLAHLQNKLAKVEQIIKEQKDLRDKADEAGKTRQTQRLPFLEPKQADLAKRTEEIQQQPSAAKPETKHALDEAAKAMEQAAKPLKDKQAPQAVAKQDEALAKLEEAKKALTDQVAEIEKRRDDIAKLEAADRKLDEMIKKENKVAEEAHAQEKKPEAADAKALAKKQGELTPPTKELGKELHKAAPEAAKHVEDSAQHMDAAKDNLDKRQLPPAAKNADSAVEELKKAQKAVAKALDEKKGMEAAEQAAMQPEVDSMNAAQQIAKALEETEKAAKDSAKAALQLDRKPQAPKPDLAKLQQDVSKQAEKVDAPTAKEPARAAAEALEKGELKKALEQQKKALAELQDAAQKKGEAAEHPEGVPLPTAAKNAGELAQAQKALHEATKALAKSQEANQAAQAALAQAQAQAPAVVQPNLQKAGQELAQANQKLQHGAALPANQGQNEAAAQLKQAMQTLDSALAQAGEKEGEGEKQDQGQGQKVGQGEKPGQGQKPGQAQKPGQGKSQKPGKSQEKNETPGKGYRVADGQLNNAGSRSGDVRGEGMFIHLPPRQRELIKQALNEKLPPEYAALIQQYYVNIARGKPASAPAKSKP